MPRIPTEVSPMDIAIVGLAGRFPGATDATELWSALRDGRSGITRFTDEQLRAAGVPDELIDDPAYVKAAAVIDGIDRFDADFFGINPKEAQILDPQHRLFLEHSWHALEDAGCDPASFDGSIGVFAGCAISTYLTRNVAPSGIGRSVGELTVGLANDKDSLTLRVAHTLGLSGPAYGIQSYCSTSLVAVCAAATSLASFECDLALAGGAAIAVPDDTGYLYQPGGISSPDGECRAFDAAGRGSLVGNGVGVVALRRLVDALADGDQVYAVIRGWAVNNDAGRKVGFTAPGVSGQAEVIAEALAATGLEPEDIDYVEAHGTGTALGDAAELAALQQVFGGTEVLIGSVKTNLGHLDRAAGVTGLIKTALSLHHGEIPATRNYTAPNPQLESGDARLTVLTERHPWPRGERPRRAGVSAFGIGGTNAHVILEEAPPVAARSAGSARRGELLVWSARTAAAADEATVNLAAHLDTMDDTDTAVGAGLSDVAYTLQSGRRLFSHRRALVADSLTGAARELRAGSALGRSDGTTGRPVVFLLTGAGAPYSAAAAELYETEPAFRAALDDCRAAAQAVGGAPLAGLLTPDRAGRPDQDGHRAFAFGYALATLFRSWGIEPDALLGHGVGEYVAGCLAGVFSLQDAVALLHRRTRPEGAALTDLAAGGIGFAAPGPALLSAAAGGRLTAAEATDPAHWTVRLAGAPADPGGALGALRELGDHALLEIGDGGLGVLADLGGEQADLLVPALPGGDDPREAGTVLTEAVGRLWLTGVDVDWAGYQNGRDVLRTKLPGYPFQRSRYWIDAPAAPAAELPAAGRTRAAIAAAGTEAGTEAAAPGAEEGSEEHVRVMTRVWSPEETDADGADPGAATGRFLLYADAAGTADALAEKLRGAGAEAVTVAPSGARDAAEPELVPGDGPLTVVVLSALDADGPDADPAAAVLGVSRTLAVWGDHAGTGGIVVVTRGGQRVTAAEPSRPAQAAVAVLPIVAGQEYPGLDARGIDLDPADDPARAAERLAAELAVTDGQVLTALRAGRRHTPRYRPVDAPAPHGAAASDTDGSAVVRPGAGYLVTGGLGDVGLMVAEHLIRGGAGRVVLAGRTGLPADPADPRRQAVVRLRALGADVQAPKLDITDAAAVRELLGAESFDGLVHAAADTAEDTFLPLGALQEGTVARHFHAKYEGARVLRAAVAALPADRAPRWGLLFSSTSAHLGGLAFGSYAAANAALAELAGPGTDGGPTRWTSAAWDTWAPTLAKVDARTGASMAAHAMTAEQSLAALDRVVTQPLPAVVVVAGGLAGRLPSRPQPVAAAPAGTAPVASFPRPDLPQPYMTPLTATERELCALWTETLGVEPVGTRDNFFDLGGSSLFALQMLATVKSRFGVTVPTVTLFEAPTVHRLAAVLDQQRSGAPAARATDRSAARDVQAAAPAATRTPAPLPAPAPRPAVSTIPTTPVIRATPAAPVQAAPAPAVGEPQPLAAPAHDLTGESGPELDRRIAIVGMAGRFPGAGDVAGFWRNLCEGVESIRFFTPEELIEAGVDPDLVDDPEYVPARAVLDDISGFDAGFFGMSPRMAALTDPQQRLFLEVCWEGLEHAGYANEAYRDRIGVFGGSNLSTYLFGMTAQLAAGDISPYEIIMSNDKDALTTSVSYLFDLRGPSVAVQTFCSTSLVGVHLAVQSLRSGECEMALAGGVSISVPDRVGHRRQQGGMESHDGHVRTFDAQASGSMFGDGATVVVLKRLSDALRDGDTVHAVIRGSAINNDGALKVGYTAPSVAGQARVVQDAMADARVSPQDIGYVEAHGTATPIGDPIEVTALSRAFGAAGGPGSIPIGAVKTNIGHLNHASGTAGLIKTALTVRERMVPATLHFTAPNPQIDFADSPFYVNTRLTEWPVQDGRPRIAGLNSLGMGGTNVHVVVEEPPARRGGPDTPQGGRRHHFLPVSARTSDAADEAVRNLGDHLAATSGAAVADVAYTLQVGRKTFEHRRTAVVSGGEHAAAALTGRDDTPVAARVETAQGRPVAFLFAGVGEQYPGLVGDLYRHEPVFRAELDRCLDLLARHLPDVDLMGLLTGDRPGGGMDLAALLGRAATASDDRAAELERTEIVQPLLFAVDHALASTLMAWGAKPALMLGYSLGEYVAACLAGVLSLEDATALVVHRARLISGMEPGAMAAVPLDPAQLGDRYELEARGLDIAAVNGPQTVVVAGPAEALAGLVADLERDGVPSRALRTTHAFHSRMLAPIADELTSWVAENIRLNPPRLPYLSNVTGGVADARLVRDPAYWAEHMCRPVRFAAAVETLLADAELAMVEIGPGQSLGAMVRGAGCPPQRWPMITATLPAQSDPRPADQVLTEAVSRLWLTGVDLDWAAYNGRSPHTAAQHGAAVPGRVPLPTYPFQRQRYWIEQTPLIGAKPAAPQALTAPGKPGVPATFEDIDRVPKLPEEQWVWQPVWRQTAAPATAGQQPGSWLVYADGSGAEAVLDALVEAAAADGATVTAVRPGDGWSADTRTGYTVRPGNAGDAQAVLRDLRKRGLGLERVVHLWTLSQRPGGTGEAIALGLNTLVALARAAGELGSGDWQLDMVTAGAHQVLDGSEARPDAAMLIGPTLVVPLEYPNVTTRLLDVEPDTPAAAIVAELRRPRTDAAVALRGNRRWLCGYDLLPVVDDETAAAVLRDRGVYLITGGLGGIGLGMAEHLARQCHARLVLFGRRGLPPRDRWAAIAAGTEPADEALRTRVSRVLGLVELGAEVEIVTGDVSSVPDVRRAIDLAEERFGALHGVLHTAGVPGTGLIQFKEADDSELVLAPKVAGVLALDEALRIGQSDETALDFLVLFSSITAATGGGPGQVDYCAGNAYLDGYAAQQAATGRRVLSVDWGEWTWNAWDSGLSGYDEGLQAFFRSHREAFGITFAEGWRSLLRALASGESRVVVSTQDLPTMVSYSTGFTVEAVMAPAGGGSGQADRHPRPELLTPYREPSGPAEERLAEVWGDMLKLERVGARDNFFELGGNSLLGIALLAALRRTFQDAELPPHILYEAPTVEALARIVDAPAADAAPVPVPEPDGQEQARLRRSGLKTAARRRGRS
ncbi:beta-ketoacyl synthase N-terminal-like domain-containing protein [Streptomyces sp. NBC_01190]|uniref:type I polyketide synthase n=1 Tax=Streptomyces sp. NBC_01190 TaxID=2903767 RepID=UPI003869895C|nr:KR domain-containing protein [Streptomyces sp. NBC_01190]